MEQRSQAAALAESTFGAGIGLENVLLVDMEPVVAVGMVLNGAVYHGANDIAGDIGAMQLAGGRPGWIGAAGIADGLRQRVRYGGVGAITISGALAGAFWAV